MNGVLHQILNHQTGVQAWKGDLEEHGRTLASNHMTATGNQDGPLEKTPRVGSSASGCY